MPERVQAGSRRTTGEETCSRHQIETRRGRHSEAKFPVRRSRTDLLNKTYCHLQLIAIEDTSGVNIVQKDVKQRICAFESSTT
jgi:hypothetical protein